MSAPKEEDFYGAITFYRELAYFLTRREEYEIALNYFDQAVKRSPNDKRSLLGRCFARSKVAKYNGALEDIAKALNTDLKDLIVIAQKALNTYLCCEFEDALMINLRNVPHRKKPDSFTMGVLHCSEAIENCVGRRAGRPLRDHYKIIRYLAWKKVREAENPFKQREKDRRRREKKSKRAKTILEPVTPSIRTKGVKPSTSFKKSIDGRKSIQITGAKPVGDEVELKTRELDTLSALSAISHVADALGLENEDLRINDSLHTVNAASDEIPPGPHFPYRPLQRYTTNIENYMSERYLDRMYLDKIFLKYLHSHSGIFSPNKGGVNRIISMSNNGFKALHYKQELLRTRRPFYFIKYQETRISTALRGKFERELGKQRKAASRDANALLYKIIEAVNEKKTRTAIEAAEKLKFFCDSTPKNILPYREGYLHQVYQLTGRAFYLMFRLNKKQYEWDQEKRIYNWLGLPRSKEPSTDSVINQFKGEVVDWKKQISIFEERLRGATTSAEMAWLYHELARFHTEVRQYELGKVYARKCITEARQDDDVYWVVNAMMLIFRICMLQRNRNDAKNELNAVMVIAKSAKDFTLVDYIDKCLTLISKVEYDEGYGARVLEKREHQIVKMMAKVGMEGEVSYLFKKMGAMPSTRRMSVMPGVKLEDTGTANAYARKMSILPGARQSEEPQPPKIVGGGSTKAEKSDKNMVKGVAFMELMKYHVD